MQQGLTHSMINRIAFIGNYMPRQCGIATFTTDLCEAIATECSRATCIAIPVNDTQEGYTYPSRVRFELAEKDIESYRRAADFLNINNVDLVCLQHEYGIFGGREGSHVLTLLRELRMPTVTTLHTILQHPNSNQRQVLKEVAALSNRLVVMSQRGVEFLQEVYDVPQAFHFPTTNSQYESQYVPSLSEFQEFSIASSINLQDLMTPELFEADTNSPPEVFKNSFKNNLFF